MLRRPSFNEAFVFVTLFTITLSMLVLSVGLQPALSSEPAQTNTAEPPPSSPATTPIQSPAPTPQPTRAPVYGGSIVVPPALAGESPLPALNSAARLLSIATTLLFAGLLIVVKLATSVRKDSILPRKAHRYATNRRSDARQVSSW
jgi:hypothetical protein